MEGDDTTRDPATTNDSPQKGVIVDPLATAAAEKAAEQKALDEKVIEQKPTPLDSASLPGQTAVEGPPTARPATTTAPATGTGGAAGNGPNGGGNGGGGANDGDRSAPVRVHLDQLINTDLGKDNSSTLAPLPRAGYKLALFVFGLICGATALIFGVAFGGFTAAAQPPGPLYYFDEASVARYQRAVDMYKSIGDIPLQRATSLFQLIVITAFLPSFTAILGYIFGSRGGASTTTTTDANSGG